LAPATAKPSDPAPTVSQDWLLGEIDAAADALATACAAGECQDAAAAAAADAEVIAELHTHQALGEDARAAALALDEQVLAATRGAGLTAAVRASVARAGAKHFLDARRGIAPFSHRCAP